MANNEFTLKRGATGAKIEATLSDTAGAFNLSGGAVTITVAKQGQTPVIDDAACDIVTAADGTIKYEFDETTANIAAGEYNVEFKATISGEVYIFPTDKRRPYGKLIVKESL